MIRRWIAAGARRVGPGRARRSSELRVAPDRPRPRAGTAAAVRRARPVHATASVRDVTRQAEFAEQPRRRRQRRSDRAGRTLGIRAARRRSWPATWATSPSSGPSCRSASRWPTSPTSSRSTTSTNWPSRSGRSSACVPSPTCDDATFLRRVTSTCAAGCRRPTRSKAFLADTAADKRTKLIDRLLDSPDYPAYFAMQWGSILRNSNLAGADQAAVRVPRLAPGHDRPQPAVRRVRPRHRRGGRRVAGRPGRSTGTGRSATTSCTRSTADTAQVFLGIAAAVRQVPPPPVRALGPGRLLRPGRLLHAAGPQELRRAAAVLRVAPRSRPARRTRSPARRRSRSSSTARSPKFTAGGRPAARPGRLDGEAGQPVLRQGAGQPHVGPLPRPRAGRRGRRHARDQPAVEPGAARRPGEGLRRAQVRRQAPDPDDLQRAGSYQLSRRADRVQQARPAELRPLLRPADDGRGVPRRGRPGDAARRRGFNGVGANGPGGRPAARGLRLVLPRHVRPAAARDRLRVRALDRRRRWRRCCSWRTRTRSRTRSPPATAGWRSWSRTRSRRRRRSRNCTWRAYRRLPTAAEKNKTLGLRRDSRRTSSRRWKTCCGRC